jgi:minor extracellular serine protease Vpr
MKSRIFRALMLAATAAGLASPTYAIRPQAASGAEETAINPVVMPIGASQAPINVVVRLTDDSVAVRQGNAGRKLTAAEKETIKGQLKAKQDALVGSIIAAGGTVTGFFQSSINGIKVRIARDKLAQLAMLPGVTGVRPVIAREPSNERSVPFIGTPAAWQSLGVHGEGIKVAIIDTGIDYTHANFGGPGTPAAYAAAHAAETSPANPALFGPGAPRVKGGIDLVGDSYDANPGAATYQPIPHPDPNPLDCADHGSHVAGTAAGNGVTSDGQTFNGPYDASTIGSHTWTIGPGVAPKADLYSVRVFGCNGSTDVVVDALEWAVANDMDVINMSLGSSFGSKDDPDAEATTNAAYAGIVVVASAGNSGPNPYFVGSPSVAEGAISVAANDSTSTFPGATISIPGASITAINANGATLAPTATYNVKVLTGANVLGCSVAAFGGPLPPNTLVVVQRGTCARVAKAIFGQQAGAAAVVMANNAAGLPPFEGQILNNPDDGTLYTVTIPFLGVAGPATTAGTSGAKLSAANGQSAVVTPALIPNPTFKGFADFSSGGPRSADSALKPDITAPGVSIFSTLNGSGNGFAIFSGTSMASPHVAGVAALTIQAHPTWSVADVKAAIVGTAAPSGVAAYTPRLGGTGLVQPASSTATQVIARPKGSALDSALNFGLVEFKKDFSKAARITLRNNGATAASFNVARANATGRPHTLSFGATTVTVPARGNVDVVVTLSVPAASAGSANGAGFSFQEVGGLVTLTPVSASDNGGITLRVPYYMVPRVNSDLFTTIDDAFTGTNPSAAASITNKRGGIAGDADFYALGVGNDTPPAANPANVTANIRAVGTQSFSFPSAAVPTRQLIVFAVNTWYHWSNASANEFDVYVDVNGDGIDDYVMFGVDDGLVRTGAFSGVMGVFVQDLRTGGLTAAPFLASAPTDSTIALLPVLSTQFCASGSPCLSVANPRMTYHAIGFDILHGGGAAVAGLGRFNPWTNAVSTGGFATVAPGAKDLSTTISINSAEWLRTPSAGLMIVTLDNQSGSDQAQLLHFTVQ